MIARFFITSLIALALVIPLVVIYYVDLQTYQDAQLAEHRHQNDLWIQVHCRQWQLNWPNSTDRASVASQASLCAQTLNSLTDYEVQKLDGK